MNKDLIEVFLFITLVVISFVSIITFPISYFEKQEFKQQIQCKEVGGTYTYENNSWVCK